MKTKKLILSVVPAITASQNIQPKADARTWYAVGIIIALLILCYLFLVLMKPDKF